GLGQLDRSGWSRYAPDLDRENAQLIDVCGLQALIDAGAFTKTSIAALTDADMDLSSPFFQDAGFSKGLSYNLFCMGHAAGIDGRIYVFGFHDKGGNNGGRKVNIFDPKKEQWVSRGTTCVRSGWEADPTGAIPPHCDSLDETNTDPPLPSDMKYQRWYPTTVALPDGLILTLSGTDQDTSVGNAGASATKVRQPVPEVYDPKTDKTVALENAQKLFNMYPRSFVTQTGPGKDDWKVCVAGGAVQPPLPTVGGTPDIRGYDPFIYNGETWCLDVRAALADPQRDMVAENHWQHIATAANAHDSGAAVRMVEIKHDGTWSQKVFLFGGNNGEEPGGNVATAEMIDLSKLPGLSELLPYVPLQNLTQTAGQNNVVALPDGTLLIVGGRAGGVNTLHYQLYNPTDGTRKDLIASPVPRHDHSTALLTPNGGVWVMGGNRVQLIPGGDENLAVPVMESYQPPYFFQGDRPVIDKAPEKIDYGQKFKLDVSGADDEIASVVLLRTGPITHNWTWDNQYVKLPFTTESNGKLQVTAPPLPGLAIAGDYLLFVVGENGVPSEGKHIRL
ncbi:MAG: galactose oxidase-like domain-containing protein, partial [bacterium]